MAPLGVDPVTLPSYHVGGICQGFFSILLANESRLMIVDRLSRGECSAGELTQLIGSDQSTVSKHLAILRAYGIVEDRREGSIVVYRLLTPCVVRFFSCATEVLKESR